MLPVASGMLEVGSDGTCKWSKLVFLGQDFGAQGFSLGVGSGLLWFAYSKLNQVSWSVPSLLCNLVVMDALGLESTEFQIGCCDL